MTPFNIVLVAPFAFAPKATVSARMLPMAAALARRGHRVHILIPPYDNPSDSGRVWTHAGITLENMVVGKQKPQSLLQLSLARQLIGRVRALKPQVIHVFKPVGTGALALWLLHAQRAMHNAKLVLDNDDWEGAGGWLDVNPYGFIQKKILAWQEHWTLHHADAVTCASEVLVARSNQFRDSASNVWLFPNGPDDALHDDVARAQAQRETLRQQFGWQGKRVLIYSGTIPNGHDMDLAIRAVAQNRADDIHFVVVATGDGLSSFKQAVANAGLTSMTEFHGFMPHTLLIERLVAADIALYPYRDTNINRAKCSGKVIDYMACAKPMVVSDVGMNRVYLQHRASAMLTRAGDADDFAHALRWLLVHPQEAEQMGQAAQKKLWATFGWGGRVAQLEQAYFESRK